MSALLLAAVGGFRRQRLNTTVTTGTTGTTTGYLFPILGSIGEDEYVDADGNTQTVFGIHYVSDDDIVTFFLDAQDVADTDQSFHRIVVGSTTFLRSDATYTGNQGGHTRWQWSSVTSTPWGANPNNFDLFVSP